MSIKWPSNSLCDLGRNRVDFGPWQRSPQPSAPGPSPTLFGPPTGKSSRFPTAGSSYLPAMPPSLGGSKPRASIGLCRKRRRRRMFSRGVWASAETIDRVRADLASERSTEGYAKRRVADAVRRDKAQADYAEDFQAAVVSFLAFHAKHADLANQLAHSVALRAVPVGSGTVARTSDHPDRATGRGRSHRLATAPDNRLRLPENPPSSREAQGGTANAGPTFPPAPSSLSARRGGPGRLPAEASPVGRESIRQSRIGRRIRGGTPCKGVVR